MGLFELFGLIDLFLDDTPKPEPTPQEKVKQYYSDYMEWYVLNAEHEMYNSLDRIDSICKSRYSHAKNIEHEYIYPGEIPEGAIDLDKLYLDATNYYSGRNTPMKNDIELFRTELRRKGVLDCVSYSVESRLDRLCDDNKWLIEYYNDDELDY